MSIDPLLILSCIAVLIASGNAALAFRNLRLYTPAPENRDHDDPAYLAAARVAVCIPARNEEQNIEACVCSALEQVAVDVRVFVYNDGSTDLTEAIVERLSANDSRVIDVARRPLPKGWNGKQHGCYRAGLTAFAFDESLNDALTHEWVATHTLFTDADVRLSPDAVANALVCFRRRQHDAESIKDCKGFGLLSTFPKQITGTLAEATVVPLIFFLLLSYLPMKRMRTTLAPAASAGCGQFLFVSRDAYRAFGGHAAFRNSMHDGIKMPRAVRRAGYLTDIYNGAADARVRMYNGLGETWRGFAKNAYEGLGSLPLLVFLTIMSLLGHIVPWVVLVVLPIESAVTGSPMQIGAFALTAAACTVALLQRVITADRLEHRAVGALLHPVGIAMMTAIQWHSFVLHATGRRSWRGRRHGVVEPA